MPKNVQSEDLLRLWTASYFLAMEAGAVMWLRSLVLVSGGPGGEREARRMIREKWIANIDLAQQFAIGGPLSPSQAAMRAVDYYEPKVRANRKRLSRRRAG